MVKRSCQFQLQFFYNPSPHGSIGHVVHCQADSALEERSKDVKSVDEQIVRIETHLTRVQTVDNREISDGRAEHEDQHHV